MWARKEQMLSKLESGRLYDIAQAVLLQHVQVPLTLNDHVTGNVTSVTRSGVT